MTTDPGRPIRPQPAAEERNLRAPRSGIRVSVPERAVTATDSEATVLAYLRLASGPTLASSEDVDRSFRVPNRYLPRGAAIRVAELLRAGRTFREAIAEVDAEAWRRRGLQDWADLLSDLAAIDSAADALDLLRTRGGLDRHYASVEQMTPHDQVEIEALDELTQWAEEVGVSEFVTKLAALATGLSVDSSDDAIELNTIHGAKGREWAIVVLLGADRDQMPHLRALSAAETDEQFDELVEDERRLAYVALTRTKERFVAVVTDEPSPFLHEAGLGSSTRPTSVPSRNEVEAPLRGDSPPRPRRRYRIQPSRDTGQDRSDGCAVSGSLSRVWRSDRNWHQDRPR